MKTNTHSLKYLKFWNILRCKKELEKLATADSIKERKIILNKSKDCVINAISEIAKNCLYGNIPLKSCDFSKLSKYQNILRKISKISPVGKRKRLIIQKGGFLNLLIPAALSIVTTIASNYLKKKISK
jgi:hypothetical protein